MTEIGQALNLNKSNVFNILSTYEKMGFVEQNKQNQKYRLSFGVLELSHSLLGRIGLRDAAYPYMKELASTIGENVYLAIPRGDRALYLEAASPIHHTYERSLSGETAPLYCTGIGKAMLAFLPPESLSLHIPKSLTAFTEYTITDENKLIAELELTRQRGFAVDNMEHEFGIKCVGVPVLDQKGMALAALSVSGPSLRFSEETMPHYAHMLKQLISRINTVLVSLLETCHYHDAAEAAR